MQIGARPVVKAMLAGLALAVNHGLLRLGQPDGDLTGFGILAIAGTLAVSTSGKRRHKAKHGRGKERRQGSLGAQQRELPKLGAKTTHTIADPAAQR